MLSPIWQSFSLRSDLWSNSSSKFCDIDAYERFYTHPFFFHCCCRVQFNSPVTWRCLGTRRSLWGFESWRGLCPEEKLDPANYLRHCLAFDVNAPPAQKQANIKILHPRVIQRESAAAREYSNFWHCLERVLFTDCTARATQSSFHLSNYPFVPWICPPNTHISNDTCPFLSLSSRSLWKFRLDFSLQKKKRAFAKR